MGAVKVRELPGIGFEVDTIEFLQQCPSRFRCHICAVVDGKLLVSRCGHQVCPKCVRQENGKLREVKCPIDGKLLKIDELKQEDGISDVLKLEIFCPYRKRGCKRSMSLSSIQSHVRSCGFVPLLCPCECGLELSRRELADHLTTQCDQRLTPCQYCEDEVPVRDHQEHLKSCAKKPIICPFCHAEITQEQASAHETKCPQRPRLCPLSTLGCSFKGTTQDLEEHENAVKEHVNVLATAVIANRESLQKVIDILNDLNTQVNNMQDEIKDLQKNDKTVKELQKSVLYLQSEIKSLHIRLDDDRGKITSPIPRGLFNHHSDSGRNSPAGSDVSRKQSAPPTPL